MESESQPESKLWYPDPDGDGYGTESATPIESVEQPPGYVDNHTDCWFQDPTRHRCVPDEPSR